MTTRTALPFLALAGLGLIACHPDEPSRGDAAFSAMSTTDRDGSIGSAISTGAALYLVQSAEFASGADPQCPQRLVSGSDVTYLADDCTSTQGVRYDGSLRAHNAPSFANDPPVAAAQPMTIEMRDWRDDDLTFDGTLEQTAAIPGNGVTYTAIATYTLDGGIGHRAFDVTADCTHHDDGEDCAFEGFHDLPWGSFEFDGDYGSAGLTSHGQMELRGVDTLRVDFDAAAAGCAPYTIDGTAAGMYCN